MKIFRLQMFFCLMTLVILICVGACQTLLGNRQLAGGRPVPLRTGFLNRDDKLVSKTDTGFYSPERPRMCAALRGNGDKVIAHLASMAGIVERFGVIDGAAGSSSSAISVFLYESALVNPLVWNCGSNPCDEQTVRSRLSFQLKMGELVVKNFLNSPMVKQALDTDNPANQAEAKQGEDFLKYGFHPRTKGLFKRLKRRIIHRFAWRIMANKFYQFTALSGADFINREILGDIEQYLIDLPAQKRWEIMRAVNALDFNNSDVSILFREGIVDFPRLYRKVGIVADFLAGRGGAYPRAKMTQLFDSSCVSSALGMSWDEFIKTSLGKNCENKVGSLMRGYFDVYRNSDPIANSRLNDPIGGALKSVVPVSVIVQGGVDKVQKAYREYKLLYETNRPDPAPGRFEDAYKAWTDRTSQIRFDLDFENELLYGYWGRYSDLKKIANSWSPSDEVKSQKFTPLGTMAWRDVLLTSPVEPGLSKINPLKDTEDHRAAGVSGYMAGGWVDLHPTQVARMIGCEKVIYITREWPEDNEFAEGLVKFFKIPEARRKSIYDINDPMSSFNQSLKEADAIWCTNWGQFKMFELAPMATQSFHSPVFSRLGDDPLFNRVTPLLQSYKPGCMPIERKT
ncbi:MAG: hypothetical protein ACKN9V_10900 [Pseudomonadota bacterium]